MESQKHGFIFENIIKSEVFNITEKIPYTSIHDIPKKYNIFDKDENVSIKTTSSNIICCGCPFRYLNEEHSDKNISVIIKYNQEHNTKTITNTIVIKTEILISLLKDIDYDKLINLKIFIKKIPKGKAENNIIIEYKKKAKEISTEIIKINPKVDSKNQRRLQFSFNLNNLIKKHNKYIIENNKGAILKNKKFKDSIISNKRKRNKIKSVIKYKKVKELVEICKQKNISYEIPKKNGNGNKIKLKRDLLKDILEHQIKHSLQ